MIKEIKLYRSNLTSIIDAEDYDRVMSHSRSWTIKYASAESCKIIAVVAKCKITHKNLKLHQVIIGKKDGFKIDHKNRNPLDNRKENLRHVTHQQNMCNQGPQEGRKYKGVYLDKRIDRVTQTWRVVIMSNGKQYCKSGFETPEQAAIYANTKYRELHGEFAYQNIIKEVV